MRDNDGCTPLHNVIHWRRRDIQFARVLLDARADLNARDEDGDTPLHYAFALGRRQMHRELIHEGADVNAMNNIGITPMGEVPKMGILLKIPTQY